jgi:uncharacterized LabA/DUF88 family protein
MKRIGIFADISNLYYCIGKKYKNRKLDYKKYYDYVKDLGDIAYAIAYGAQINDEAKNFVYFLRHIGFQTKYKTPKTYNNDTKIKRKADWDVGITIDIVNFIERLDLIILGTADSDLVPAVKWAQDKGVKVVILACGISRDLKNCAHECIEVPESMLEEPKKDDETD